MAVRHGYGKIAGTDALVFAYDTGDTRNSYKGEPTTNIIADPLYRLGVKNAYYDTNNTGWGTVTRAKIEEVIGPFGKPVQAYSQELISYTSANRSMEGQPQEVVNNANCLANLTAGITYRISVWIKATYTGTSQNRLYLSGTAAGGDSANRQVTTEWQRFSRTYTPSTTGNYYMRHYDYSTKNTGDKIWYAHPQVEVDKGHDTQFIEGTRSATQGLLDLTGNRSISLTNVSFDSNAQLTWDGTNDTLDTGIPVTDLPALSNFTIECIAKIDSYPTVAPPNGYGSTTRCGVLVGATYYSGTALYWYGNTSGDQCAIYAYIRGNDAYRTAGPFYMVPGNHHHLVLVNNNETTTLHLYADGIQIGSVGGPTQEYNSGLAALAGNIGISKAQVDGGGEAVYSYLPVDVPVTKIYNRALTADEVRNNYRHYKTRFNI